MKSAKSLSLRVPIVFFFMVLHTKKGRPLFFFLPFIFRVLYNLNPNEGVPFKRDRILLRRRIGRNTNRVVTKEEEEALCATTTNQPTKRFATSRKTTTGRRVPPNRSKTKREEKDFVTSPSKEEEEVTIIRIIKWPSNRRLHRNTRD